MRCRSTRNLPKTWAVCVRRHGFFRRTTSRDFLTNFKFLVDRLGPAAKILKEYGHRIGLEFIGPITLRKGKRYPFIHTLEGMRGLAAAIGTGNVGILLDVWHLYTAHGSLDDVREMRQEEIVVVHVNDAPAGVDVDAQLDNVRLLPGESGVIDIAGFLQTLAAMGYDGPVTVEPFSQRVRDMDRRSPCVRRMPRCRRCIGRLDCRLGRATKSPRQ